MYMLPESAVRSAMATWSVRSMHQAYIGHVRAAYGADASPLLCYPERSRTLDLLVAIMRARGFIAGP